MMPKQAKTGEEEKGGVAEPWETDEPKDAEQNTKDTMPRETQRFLSSKRRVRYPETLAVRAKEQSEVLETLFECTTEEAHAISKRLKVLGPGCRLYEAPPLIAYELSGIPVDTYKGLASGKLIATMPLNEVKDVGTSPEKFAADIGTDTTGLPAEELAGPLIVGNDIATDTADLPTEEVAGPLIVGNDIATDTADLPVEEVTNPKTSFNHWTLLLYGLMIIFGLLCVYMGMKSDPKTGPQYGILYKNIYSHRHTPFATPSSQASTPIIFVHPPSPAPQLGLARMMMGGLLGGGLGGGR